MAGRTKSKDLQRANEVRHILQILQKWGILSLGQFANLDKEDLNARLGPAAVRLWERANGKSTRLLKLVQPPESFGENFEFEHDVETVEPLLFMLRRFLQQLALRLSGIYLVAKDLTVRITFADKKYYERCFKIPQPTNDVDLLFRMLHTHLENFKSEQPIVAVSLEAQPIKPARQQFGLFETALRDPNQLYETLARLTALLGTDRIGTPVLEETYRPDAFHLEPFVWQLGGTTSVSSHYSPDATERVPPLGPALRCFRSNVSAAVLLDENKPVHIRSARTEGEVVWHKGPYSTSGNWWDDTGWSRIEWDVQLENGVVARCHQSPPSLNSGVAGESGWKIDGIYD
jgi:protein ImuB